ncbi:hypothetical protein HanRHA438_Chr09g0386681 [Helianthus annuus]|nr:hypothetical protein HanRHA438_Chr09g0386681 [Helianthus annuus]
MHSQGEISKPGKDGTTVTLVFFGATNFGMSLPVTLYRISFGAFLTFPFLFSVFSTIMFLDSG